MQHMYIKTLEWLVARIPTDLLFRNDLGENRKKFPVASSEPESSSMIEFWLYRISILIRARLVGHLM